MVVKQIDILLHLTQKKLTAAISSVVGPARAKYEKGTWAQSKVN